MSIPVDAIREGALLRRGSRYRLVTEVWSAETNPKMQAARGEARRVGLLPPSDNRVRVQYLPVNADCSPLETNEHKRPAGWRWADLATLQTWTEKVVT